MAISWECWNSAQSILMQARASPNKVSDMASTTRVFPDPVGPRNKQIADRPSRRIQSRQKHLIDFDHLFQRGVLADDLAAQGLVKISGVSTAAGGIEHCVKDGFHSGRFPFLAFR